MGSDLSSSKKKKKSYPVNQNKLKEGFVEIFSRVMSLTFFYLVFSKQFFCVLLTLTFAENIAYSMSHIFSI